MRNLLFPLAICVLVAAYSCQKESLSFDPQEQAALLAADRGGHHGDSTHCFGLDSLHHHHGDSLHVHGDSLHLDSLGGHHHHHFLDSLGHVPHDSIPHDTTGVHNPQDTTGHGGPHGGPHGGGGGHHHGHGG